MILKQDNFAPSETNLFIFIAIIFFAAAYFLEG